MIVLAALTLIIPISGGAVVKESFLYKLSDFTGAVPYDGPRVSVDKERNEVYVLFQNLIRVFNEHGMEIYRFGEDLDLGQILDVVVDQRGDILLLSYMTVNGVSNWSLSRCNYRADLISKIEIKNLPSELSDFFPNRMVYQKGDLYFVSFLGLRTVITDSDGNFKKSYDLFSLLDLQEKDRGNVEISGFSVDERGNILFTVAVLFKAYILSPDGQLTFFGKPGGAPGRFNVVAGIAADSKGNYLVADKLKSAVMIFDSRLNFITQFGYRGSKPWNLIVPDEIAIDKQDRIFVTQARKRGVSVFKLTY